MIDVPTSVKKTMTTLSAGIEVSVTAQLVVDEQVDTTPVEAVGTELPLGGGGLPDVLPDVPAAAGAEADPTRAGATPKPMIAISTTAMVHHVFDRPAVMIGRFVARRSWLKVLASEGDVSTAPSMVRCAVASSSVFT